ncbi:hypothetical protein ACFOKI_05635 [Sphingomonas qilianensis]|uniref:Uncharacterized protein n=1 Tax=Sphingomonas qilianensis TaxID=1736690 RepID=A0ABU9XRL1_9SPHN
MADDFPLLRASLGAEYAHAEADQLEAIVQQIYGPEATAEDVESLFGDIGRGLKHAAGAVGQFAQKAAPVVAKAVPGMIQGASAGAALGPWGALAGGIAGGAGSILSQSGNPTARAVGGGIGTVSNLVSTVRGGGPAGALGALGAITGGKAGGRNPLAMLGGGGGANALLGLLMRPETLQALSASAMGGFGRPTVPVGAQQVPVNMLMSALGTLANRTAHEAAEYYQGAESLPGFMEDAGEALGLDVEDAEGRADTLLTLLALSPSIWGAQAQRPVNVTVTPPAEPAYRPAPPLVTAGEDVWESDTGEDYETSDEAWPNYDEAEREDDPLYV